MINKFFIILLPLVISTEAKRNGDLSKAKAFTFGEKITAYQLFRNKKMPVISRLHYIPLEMTNCKFINNE